MLVQINYTCIDKYGSWPSESSGWADNDESAKAWADSEIAYMRKRFPDITFSNVELSECDLATYSDRFICEIR